MAKETEHPIETLVSQAGQNTTVSRRQFLGLSAAALGAMTLTQGCGSSGGSSSSEQPPNILFILTDNQPTWMLGCYGSKTVKTPHIDKLAAEGVRFTRTFACNGMCSPTRASLMTGLLPSQHGIFDAFDDSDPRLDSTSSKYQPDWCAVQEFRTLPLTLANRGYQTAMIGKYHLGQPRHVMPGFQSWVTFPYGHTLDFWNNTIIENSNGQIREFELNNQHIVQYFATRGAEYIKNYTGDKPFYLQLNFDGPYLLPPTNLGKDNNRFYADYVNSDFPDWPKITSIDELDYGITKFTRYPDDPNNLPVHLAYQIIQMSMDPASKANTASQNAMVDYGVGIVMQALKDAGLDKNTLVIFATDQADYYGQHGLFAHTTETTPSRLYDSLMNIPFIMRQPGTLPANQVCDLMIGQYDIMPTLLDLAGHGDVTVANTPGKSFAPCLKNPIASWGDAVFFEQEDTRGIRTTRYAYWKRPEKVTEGVSAYNTQHGIDPAKQPTDCCLLYDILADKDQNTNLAKLPEYAQVVAELDQRLTGFFDRYADPGYDLWKNGKTKSYTQRIQMLNASLGYKMDGDLAQKPMFVDPVTTTS